MRLIKTTIRYDSPAYGLTRQEDTRLFILRLPLFPWYGRSYQISMDEYVTGWHVKDLIARFGVGDHTICTKQVQASAS